MASFDDLQFAGLSGGTSAVHCPICSRIYDLPPTATTCPNNHPLPQHSHNPLMPYNQPPPATQPARTINANSSSATPASAASASTSASASPFINFPALAGMDLSSFPNANFLAMLAAQQNLNMDDLMQSLLNDTSHNSTATSAAYLAQLKAQPLSEEDFTQLALRVQSIDRDLLPVQAEFGRKVRCSKSGDSETAATEAGAAAVVATEGEEEKAGRIERQLTGKLVLAQPLDGKDLSNSTQLHGRVAVLQRGRITFVDKCRAVQRAGALAAVVLQTDETWPYKMTDATRSGGDIDIPCMTVSERDGQTLQAAINKRKSSAAAGEEKEDGGLLTVELVSRDRQLACPVCRDDFTFGESAIRLPCNHSYHQPCILDWLKQRNLCPLCRYELPTDNKTIEEKQQADAERKQLREAMFT